MATRGVKARKEVQFVCSPGMARGARIVTIGILAAIGVLLQCGVLLFVSAPDLMTQVQRALVGWPFLFVAVLFGLVRGSSNEPRFKGEGKWEQVTMEEFERVLKIQQQTERFKSGLGCMSAGSIAGCGGLLAALAAVGVACGVVFAISPDSQAAAVTLGIDALTLVIPVWLCGATSAWQPTELLQKLKPLLNVYHHAMLAPDPALVFAPMLEVRDAGEGKVPTDARMLVRWKPEVVGFIGVQVQVSLNSVQGTKYPYLYCVLLSRIGFPLHEQVQPMLTSAEELGLLKRVFGGGSAQEKKEAQFSTYRSEVAELSREKDVEIVVLRQKAVGTGYHTTEAQQRRVFQNAMTLARAVLGAEVSRQSAGG